MLKCGSGWKWPSEDDEIWYKYEDVMQLIKSPSASNSKGVFHIPEIQNYKKVKFF